MRKLSSGEIYGVLHAVQCGVAVWHDDGRLLDTTTGKWPTTVIAADGTITQYGLTQLPIWDECQLAHVRATWSV